MDLARIILHSLRELRKDPIPFLLGDARILNDAWTCRWEFVAPNKDAQMHFYGDSFANVANAILSEVHIVNLNTILSLSCSLTLIVYVGME